LGFGEGVGDGFGDAVVVDVGFGERLVVVGAGAVDVLVVAGVAAVVVGVAEVDGAAAPLVLVPAGAAVRPNETAPQPASAVAAASRPAATAVRVPGLAARMVSPWPGPAGPAVIELSAMLTRQRPSRLSATPFGFDCVRKRYGAAALPPDGGRTLPDAAAPEKVASPFFELGRYEVLRLR
jgi:hypothetical protein